MYIFSLFSFFTRVEDSWMSIRFHDVYGFQAGTGKMCHMRVKTYYIPCCCVKFRHVSLSFLRHIEVGIGSRISFFSLSFFSNSISLLRISRCMA